MTAFALAAVIAGGPTDPDDHFRSGVAARADAAAARRQFAAAAKRYGRGEALRRGRAYFLAGDAGKAVAALHAGLAAAPWDADLLADLRAVRGTVRYPEPADPAARVRPDPPTGLRHRVSPWDVFLLAVAAAVAAGVGLAARLTIRPGWSTPTMLAGVVGMLLAVSVAAVIAADPPAVLVVARETPLRKGNGDAYPPRTPDPLPAGAEVTPIVRRGGWVQVRLAGGAVGWLPEAAVIDPAD